MSRGLIVVKVAYDADAAVWFVESSDLAGVNAEAPTLETLLQKLPGIVLDLLDEEGPGDFAADRGGCSCQHAGAPEHCRLKGLRQGRAQNPHKGRVHLSPAGPW